MPLVLPEIPGFADLNPFGGEGVVFGFDLARVNDNATFGMVRTEVFVNQLHHGDIVPLPISPHDKYQYSRDELLYFWTFNSTASPKSGLPSYMAPWTMWYGVWNVDQTTGLCESVIGYRGNPDHTSRQAQTNDGTLIVWTIAQRQRSDLTMTFAPPFNDIHDSEIYVDAPVYASTVSRLNRNSKFGITNAEVIYMGDFSNGQTVPNPVSPADGYFYNRSLEVQYMHCWRWSADGTTHPITPSIPKGQLMNFTATVNASTGVVTTTVKYKETGVESSGRIAVFAFCKRDYNYVDVLIPSNAIPWRVDGGRNAAHYYAAGDAPNGYPADANVAAPLTVDIIEGLAVTISVNPSLTAPLYGIPVQTGNHRTNCDGSVDSRVGLPGLVDGPPHVQVGYPDAWLPATYGVGAVVGCFTDLAGEIIGNPFYVGPGVTVTAPIGSKKLSLGINDFLYNDNKDAGFGVGFYFGRVQQTIPLHTVGQNFSIIPVSTFFPGHVLKASTIDLMNKNAREAMATPEYAHRADVGNAYVVPLFVSPIDGYTYIRSEQTVIWTWESAGDASERVDHIYAGVNGSTGVVTVGCFVLFVNDDGTTQQSVGTIRIMTMAHRERTADVITDPPLDTPSSGTDAEADEGIVFVEGVAIGTLT